MYFADGFVKHVLFMAMVLWNRYILWCDLADGLLRYVHFLYDGLVKQVHFSGDDLADGLVKYVHFLYDGLVKQATFL